LGGALLCVKPTADPRGEQLLKEKTLVEQKLQLVLGSVARRLTSVDDHLASHCTLYHRQVRVRTLGIVWGLTVVQCRSRHLCEPHFRSTLCRCVGVVVGEPFLWQSSQRSGRQGDEDDDDDDDDDVDDAASDASSLSSEIADPADFLPAAAAPAQTASLADGGGGVWFDALLNRLEHEHARKLEHA
jgi:hypothetical protein